MRHIKWVINREEKGKMWYWINCVTDDTKMEGITCVERMAKGKKVSYTYQESMVSCIQGVTKFRFHLCHSSYIKKTSLASKLGCLSDIEVARQLIDGTYGNPNDVDDETALVWEEITRLGIKMRSSRVK